MNKFDHLQWSLIIGMGALALIRPVFSITGVMGLLGRPFGPLLISGLISLAWIVIVVFGRVRQPLLTLVCAGLVYGVCAILLGAILSPILQGELMGPITNPAAIVAVLVTNTIWGAIIGLCALVIQKMTGPKKEI